MSREKHKILTEVLGRSFKTGNEHLFRCPKCNHHKNKMSVNYAKDAFKCWVCEYSGNSISRIIRKFGDYSQRQEWATLDSRIEITDFDCLFGNTEAEEPHRQVLQMPEGFTSLASTHLPARAIIFKNYLIKRGLTESDILRWKIGYCATGEYANRVVIPSFDESGYLNYYVARTTTKDWPTYKNPQASKNIIFNDLFVDWDEDIIIVEGVFDAIKAGNSIPLLGSTLNESSKLFQKLVLSGNKIYIALDSDATKKSLKIIRKLLQYDVDIYSVDISPYSDVAEMTAEEFKERKEKASFVGDSDYLLYHTLNL